MRKSSYSPSTTDEIVKLLGPRRSINHTTVAMSLKKLAAEGKIAISKNGQYYLPKAGEITGTFQANKKGFGFVLGSEYDVYINSTNVMNAMNGDMVQAEITKRRKGFSFEGRITKVIERATTKVIGRVEPGDNKYFVVPSDRRLNAIFEITSKVECKTGTIVEAKILKYPTKGIGQCEVTEVIGSEDLPGVEVEMIVREHDLRTQFPREVLDEAVGAPSEVRAQDTKGRVDYRNDYVVTIDGLDAKDFDDAVQISHEKGLYNLKVHIADVSHYVKPGSALDKEAYLRSFSTYLADRVLPMLPEALSNGICSLNPDVDRLTMSVDMTIDKSGDVKFFDVNRGVIRSKSRLTYTEVDKRLKSGDFVSDEQRKTLTLLSQLSDILEAKRERHGALNFETIEPKIIINDKGVPVEIIVRERTPSTKLIEEAMVLTNQVVGTFVFTKNVPLIYRIHEDPSEDALKEVKVLLGQMGYPSKKLSKATADAFQSIIKFAHQRPDKLIINNILLRLMKKARYSTLKAGHFGLAMNHYSHFTSPIRRYPDLLTHRQIKAILDNKPKISEEYLTEASTQACIREVEGIAAERETDDVYVCMLMKDHVGDVFDGIVSSVTNFGLFVQLPNTAEGLVHIKNLTGDYYRHEPERFLLRGLRKGQVYRLGSKVKVKLINVSVGDRQIDLEIV